MTVNTYTHTTLAQAEVLLAQRLADTGYVRFLADELDMYIVDAIRTFSALTGMWQDSGITTIAAGTDFIDLPSIFPLLRGYTVEDRDLVGIMEYHLLEKKNISGWSGTEMFTLAQFTQAIQQRRDQFLLETGCRISQHAPIPAAPAVITPGMDEVALDQSIIDIRRAAWTTLDSRTTPLWTSSNWALRGASPTWNLDSALPKAYAYNQHTPGIIQLAPPPAASGTLDLLTVDSGATLNPVLGVLLGIPDDFAPFVKWGALADLLAADGPARDYARSLFCERRYQMGVAAAKIATVLIDARFNNKLAQFSSIASLDAAPTMLRWQNRTGTPTVLAPIGLNMLACALPPATTTSLEVTLVRNAPVPALPGDFIQVPKEHMDSILGYAVHLAMFKIGGQQLAATTHLADMFFALAQERNDKLSSISVFEDDQRLLSQAQERAKPRRVARQTGSTVQ